MSTISSIDSSGRSPVLMNSIRASSIGSIRSRSVICSSTTVGAISLTLLAAAWFVLGLIKLFGQAGIIVGAVTIMLIGNPLSGMTSAAELLPAPWGDVGQLMVPGAGATLLRSVSFFDGNGAATAAIALASWLAVGVVLFIAGAVRASSRGTAAGAGASRESDLVAPASEPVAATA
jgi:hypothetical protein